MGRWLVTAGWPYINYMPHLGTMIGSVLSADVMARYLRLKGEDVVFVSGSDEHGTPIEVEAVRLKVSPRELTDVNHGKVSELFKRWGISFDNYTRTESPIHKGFVQEFYMKVYRNGYIFQEEVELPYCLKCERFLPDRFIEGVCPYCGYEEARGDQCDSCGRLLEPTRLIKSCCTVCRNPPVVKKTSHWFFNLPRFTEALRRYVEGNKQLPDNARNFSLRLLEEGLKPRSLTRDSRWGIQAPFPGAEDKTIYVWVEAVLGYISATIEYFRSRGCEDGWMDYWFNKEAKTLYFIAKDNIPFHTLIFPALLLATGDGYNLPWNVDSTEFLLFEGKKFSKSRRVGVWIDEALNLFPADYWRYVLISIRPEVRDASFTWDMFIEKINSELNDTLGNFIHRTLTFINQYFDGFIPKPNQLDSYDEGILSLIKETQEKASGYLDKFKLQAALSTIMDLCRAGNKYLNDKEPWKKIKKDPEKAATTLYIAARIVKALAIMLTPFIPFTTEKMWSLLNLEGSIHEQNWLEALKEVQPGARILKPKPLFTKISEEERKALKGLKEEVKPLISIKEFSKADLRVGEIINVETIPEASKLLKLFIDIGEGEIRQVVAGIAEHYKLEELKGRQVVVVANLESAYIHGIESQAMILAAVSKDIIALVQPDKKLKPGSKVV